jgi:hypothetical protein
MTYPSTGRDMLGRTIRRAATALLAVIIAGALCAPAASAQSGGPVLVVTDSTGFDDYYAEILRAEGLNEFAVADVGQLSSGLLSSYQVVLLAQTQVSDAQAGALAGWVNGGGNLIAMRPDARLAGLLGLGSSSDVLSDGYMAIDTSSAPGAGITSGTMQYHGVADLWSFAGARHVAALYTTSSTSTPANAPAVTLRDVGGAGGQAAAFTYDLAESVVKTRQGNPAWAGDERDGSSPLRSDDLFFGAKAGDIRPDWVDFSKIRVPQADEQQRLLANLVIQMNLDRAPLPRFWYLPRGEQAAVVMTGDDHGSGGTRLHFDRWKAASRPGCSVADWECVRATSYVYDWTSVPGATGYQADGFEIALHLNTNCGNFTPSSINADWNSQLSAFAANFPGINAPRTNRTHCIVWSDWATAATSSLAHGVRLDTNYYYWPGSWLQNRPGLFTGSGLPMRFADTDGSLIDVYQAATQLTDESGQDPMSTHIRTLIDGALGSDGYYGVFTANMHTDDNKYPHAGADQIIAEAQFRGVPVVSAVQMLNWLDGRNGSSFQGLSYDGNRLRFSVRGGAGSRGLQAMLPASAPSGALSSLTRNGVSLSAPARRVKGMDYAFFDAADGDYVATYGSPVPDTAITEASVTGNRARFAFVSNTPGATYQCRLDGSTFAACPNPKTYSGLSKGAHTFQVRAIDPAGTPDPTPAERRFTVGTSELPGGSGEGANPGEGGSGPRVRLAPKRLRLWSDGTVRMRVRCPASERTCRVRLRLRKGQRLLAARSFKVKGGKTRNVRLQMSRGAIRLLVRHGTLRVTAIAVSRDMAGDRAVTRKTIRLVAP